MLASNVSKGMILFHISNRFLHSEISYTVINACKIIFRIMNSKDIFVMLLLLLIIKRQKYATIRKWYNQKEFLTPKPRE